MTEGRRKAYWRKAFREYWARRKAKALAEGKPLYSEATRARKKANYERMKALAAAQGTTLWKLTQARRKSASKAPQDTQ